MLRSGCWPSQWTRGWSKSFPQTREAPMWLHSTALTLRSLHYPVSLQVSYCNLRLKIWKLDHVNLFTSRIWSKYKMFTFQNLRLYYFMHCWPSLAPLGYPVLRHKVDFKRGGCCANKEDLNKFVMAAKVDTLYHACLIRGWIPVIIYTPIFSCRPLTVRSVRMCGSFCHVGAVQPALQLTPFSNTQTIHACGNTAVPY